MSQPLDEMNNFVEKIGNRFAISESIIDDEILFNGCKITQDSNGSVKISMEDYMSGVQFIPMDHMRRKEQKELAT